MTLVMAVAKTSDISISSEVMVPEPSPSDKRMSSNIVRFVRIVRLYWLCQVWPYPMRRYGITAAVERLSNALDQSRG
jgi:hypothetical protein